MNATDTTSERVTTWPPYHETELHDFLLPRFEMVAGLVKAGRIDTLRVAELCGVSRYSVYRWFQGKLTINGARKLCGITVTKDYKDGTVSVDELVDFIC